MKTVIFLALLLGPSFRPAVSGRDYAKEDDKHAVKCYRMALRPLPEHFCYLALRYEELSWLEGYSERRKSLWGLGIRPETVRILREKVREKLSASDSNEECVISPYTGRGMDSVMFISRPRK